MHRNVRHGRIGWVRPARVVADDDRGLLLWVARDTPVAHEVTEAGLGMRAMPFAEWITSSYRLARGRWNGPPLLKFLPTGAAHSVWWFRDADGPLRPLVRQPGGAGRPLGRRPGGRGRHRRPGPRRGGAPRPELGWKDEDEFAERLAFPEHYWVTDETAVRAEGERVIKLAEAGEFPFDGTWCDFTPTAGWAVPDGAAARLGPAAGPLTECLRHLPAGRVIRPGPV